MLGKLMKHEFRATARTMLPLFLVVLALSFAARFSARLLENDQSFLLEALGVLVIIAFVIALVVAAVFSVVLMVSRFYKNLMTDEGYLMFTLPVNVHQLLWSKIIVSAVWFIGTFLVDVLAIFILAYEGGMVQVFFSGFRGILVDLPADLRYHVVLFVVEIVALLLIGLLGACLNFYAPISLGHAFANNKVLLSVVFYFVFNGVWQTLGTVGSVPLINWVVQYESVTLTSVEQVLKVAHTGIGIVLAAALIQSVVMYFFTAFMLKKHRNLQ